MAWIQPRPSTWAVKLWSQQLGRDLARRDHWGQHSDHGPTAALSPYPVLESFLAGFKHHPHSLQHVRMRGHRAASPPCLRDVLVQHTFRQQSRAMHWDPSANHRSPPVLTPPERGGQGAMAALAASPPLCARHINPCGPREPRWTRSLGETFKKAEAQFGKDQSHQPGAASRLLVGWKEEREIELGTELMPHEIRESGKGQLRSVWASTRCGTASGTMPGWNHTASYVPIVTFCSAPAMSHPSASRLVPGDGHQAITAARWENKGEELDAKLQTPGQRGWSRGDEASNSISFPNSC